MFNFTGLYTDQYQLTMAQAYYMKGQKVNITVFDYFFRKLPFSGGYVVFAGLEVLLDVLENLRFDKNDLEFLKEKGFNRDFISFLEKFRFTGNIYSAREGDLVFPVRPVLQVEADIIEAQIIETILLNLLNFQSLVATKASRMRLAAGDRALIDFGLRRAQGPGGYYASRASVIGGFNATSNVVAGRDFDIPVSGTMAHSYIESFDSELAAFEHFARVHPDECVLLVDTYDTLNSGLPNAVITAKKMEENGHRLKGIRLDSGDLAYLSRKSREVLNNAGLDYVKIAVSNQLDEYIIQSLIEQKAPIDIFGVGTCLVTGYPDASLDGVYKLAFADGKPRIKLSENVTKITLPHRKQVFRILEKDGSFTGADAVTLAHEKDVDVIYHPLFPAKRMFTGDKKMEPLLIKVMEGGRRLSGSRTLAQIRDYSKERLGLLPGEYKRFNNPHVYKVGLSEKLRNERDRLIEENKKP
ncbi:MAG TPA: nicotinate phosphoribosyltransferase [Bacteroidales bacterium]|jgi:nicotinate phosphoribosyltransferase|nr:nicotinate phosphoribosyltransferase [Bacteroidales bacterium]